MENLNSTVQSEVSNDKADLIVTMSGFVTHVVQPLIGLAVVATNIALIYFYKHGEKASKITLLFLTSLTSSDVMFGMKFIIRFVVVSAAPDYIAEACRFVFAPGAVISVTVSAWSILLITIQVCNDVKHFNSASN